MTVRSEQMERSDRKKYREEIYQMLDVIEALKVNVQKIKHHKVFENKLNPEENHGEMKTNISLAFRRLEEVQFRLLQSLNAMNDSQLIDAKNLQDELTYLNNKRK